LERALSQKEDEMARGNQEAKKKIEEKDLLLSQQITIRDQSRLREAQLQNQIAELTRAKTTAEITLSQILQQLETDKNENKQLKRELGDLTRSHRQKEEEIQLLRTQKDEAIQQRDQAVKERDQAFRERDGAIRQSKDSQEILNVILESR